MAETIRSPLRLAAEATMPPPHSAPEYPAPPAADGPAAASIATHFVATEELVAKAEVSGTGDGDGMGVDWYSWSGQRAEAGGSRSVTGIIRQGRWVEALEPAAVAARIAAAVLCLVAFSVLAADTKKGWALDDYHFYKQFRYSVSVNVIGFLYSGFQVYAYVHHMLKERHIIRTPIRNYFDFAMDQILAYLLISSSSSATARVGDWVSNWGRDPFPNMANGSVAVSFLAFLALSISSLISAYNLFGRSL